MARFDNPFDGISLGRFHVMKAAEWNRAVGTDYWMIPATNDELTAAATNYEILSNADWTTTSLTHGAGSAGDLLAAIGGDVAAGPVWVTNAASDELLSPAIFGSAEHATIAAAFLGYAPTKLSLEWLASFSVATSAETASALGFTTGSIITATNQVLAIYSDGTNFKYRTTGTTSTAGAAVDNAVHKWKITLDKTLGKAFAYMDGAIIGAAAGLALVNDLFPCSIGFGNVAAGNNRIQAGIAHVWYE